ncbi:hypothetical protein D3C85_428610 [compost metagenome]
MQQRDAGAGQHKVEDIKLHQERRAAQDVDVQAQQLMDTTDVIAAYHTYHKAQQRAGDDGHERYFQRFPEALQQEGQHDAGGGKIGIQHAYLAFQAGPANQRLTPRDNISMTP